MISDLPVESVHGQSEWAWNERRADDRPTRSAERPPDHRQNTGDRAGSPVDRAAAQREIRRLEAELAQKEQQLQDVIEQYEQLLERKNRRIAGNEPSGPEADPLAAVRSVVDQYAAGGE